MAGGARPHLLVVCTVLLCGTAFGSFVTDKDTQLAADAAEKQGRVCKDIKPIEIKGDEKKRIKDDLVDASGIYGAMMRAMKKSNSSDEFSTNMAEEQQNEIGSLLPKAAPLIAFFIFSPVYFCICCWAYWPCCKCCLCCRKTRSCPCMCKLVYVIVLGGLIFGIVLAGFLSLRGFGASNEGFKSTSCTSAELVSSILNGQGTQGQANYFDGMINTLRRFDTLKTTLKYQDCSTVPASDRTAEKNPGCFLYVLQSQLDNTVAIERSVVRASETVGLLVTMMSPASGNLEPKDKTLPCNQVSEPGCLHHYCSLCKQLSDPLQRVKDALQSSVAQALNDARKSVQNQLQGAALADLEKSFDGAAQPLTGLTDLISSSLGPFVKEDSMENLSDPMNTYGALASTFLILCGLLIAACGGTSITAWMCLEKRKSATLRKLTHRCACCTWNSGCVYILFAFLIGGILMIVTMFLSSFCLLMEDIVLTPSLLDDMSRAMGVELSSGPQMTMLKDILGQCFKPDNPTNPLLLKILKVENSTGEITMHQMIVGNTKDQINAQFDKIATTSSIPKLEQNTDIKALTDLLKDNSMSSWMIPKWLDPDSSNYIAKTPTGTGTNIQGTMSLPRYPELNPYTISHADRLDGPTIPDPLGTSRNVIIKGLETFVDAMNTAAAKPGNNGWGGAVSGAWKDKVRQWGQRSTSASCTGDPGCDAASHLMKFKYKLISEKLYRCTYFGPSSSTLSSDRCDVTTSQCTSPSGNTFTMPTYTIDCDLDEFTRHVKRLGSDLDFLFKELDTNTMNTMAAINVNMKGAVNTFVLDEITRVSTGLTCGVFGEKYWKFLDGMCYKGVWGMRAMASAYSATAGLTFVVVILIYMVWRISLDNSVLGLSTNVEKYDGQQNEVMVK